MLRKFGLILFTTLIASGGAASAAATYPWVGPTSSILNTSFCKTYKCVFQNSKDAVVNAPKNTPVKIYSYDVSQLYDPSFAARSGKYTAKLQVIRRKSDQAMIQVRLVLPSDDAALQDNWDMVHAATRLAEDFIPFDIFEPAGTKPFRFTTQCADWEFFINYQNQPCKLSGSYRGKTYTYFVGYESRYVDSFKVYDLVVVIGK